MLLARKRSMKAKNETPCPDSRRAQKRDVLSVANKINKRNRSYFLILLISLLPLTAAGCKTASTALREEDRAVNIIIREKQEQALGSSEEFTIERPADILRRRLLIEQDLPRSGDASLGTDRLKPIEHWPLKDYPGVAPSSDGISKIEPGKRITLSLMQALEVGALNSPDYQTKKEDVFRAALNLDLTRVDFSFIFEGQANSSYSVDSSSGDPVRGTEESASLDVSKQLKSGVSFTTALAADLVSLLTQGRTSSFGILADASISIPLLRGSGRYIVTEPLTQAERNVVYAIYEFERFKKTFAVELASSYLVVLRQMDQVKNALENYNNLKESARRSRMLADAGRFTEIEVDQAVQNELFARNRWINETNLYRNLLDSFKNLMGLPPDADIDLNASELEGLNIMDSGLLGMDERLAIELGLENRLDLRVSEGKVYDAQRKVVVQADALGAELTLLGTAELGQSRSLDTAGLEDARLRSGTGIYTGLLSLDLPFERTAERIALRDGLISLERSVRSLQGLEDDIKLSIRNKLRDMSKARESLIIQTRAVSLAEKRVKSVAMFLEAGRAQLRDLLDAQEALLNARNLLIAAKVEYRVAELEFQRDTGLLKIDRNGLLEEYPQKGKG